MKRLLLMAALVALVLPSLGTATTRNPGDGTLSVQDGRGTFLVSARGGVIGSFARGRVIITDPNPDDGTGPIVSMSSDDIRRERSDTTTAWYGTKIRFRLIGGYFKIKVVGRGVNLSVVGRGQVTFNGEGTLDDGSYSLNGADYVPVSPDQLTFALNGFAPSPE
jgi:hypothetical protein